MPPPSKSYLESQTNVFKKSFLKTQLLGAALGLRGKVTKSRDELLADLEAGFGKKGTVEKAVSDFFGSRMKPPSNKWQQALEFIGMLTPAGGGLRSARGVTKIPKVFHVTSSSPEIAIRQPSAGYSRGLHVGALESSVARARVIGKSKKLFQGRIEAHKSRVANLEERVSAGLSDSYVNNLQEIWTYVSRSLEREGFEPSAGNIRSLLKRMKDNPKLSNKIIPHGVWERGSLRANDMFDDLISKDVFPYANAVEIGPSPSYFLPIPKQLRYREVDFRKTSARGSGFENPLRTTAGGSPGKPAYSQIKLHKSANDHLKRILERADKEAVSPINILESDVKTGHVTKQEYDLIIGELVHGKTIVPISGIHNVPGKQSLADIFSNEELGILGDKVIDAYNTGKLGPSQVNLILKFFKEGKSVSFGIHKFDPVPGSPSVDKLMKLMGI